MGFLILISLPGFLDDQSLSLLWRVLLSLAGHHAVLYFLVPLDLHFLLPLLVDVK